MRHLVSTIGLLAVATTAFAQETGAGRSGSGAGTGSGGALAEGWSLYWLWLTTYWVSLLVSVLILWGLACAFTYIFGMVVRVRVVIAPPLGLLSAAVLWAIGIAYYTLFRPGAFVLTAAPWTFWLLLGLTCGVVIVASVIEYTRRQDL